MKHFFLQKKVFLAKNRGPEYAQLNTPIDYCFENCLIVLSHTLFFELVMQFMELLNCAFYGTALLEYYNSTEKSAPTARFAFYCLSSQYTCYFNEAFVCVCVGGGGRMERGGG